MTAGCQSGLRRVVVALRRRAVETHTVKVVLFVMEAVALKSNIDEEQAEKMTR